MWLFTRYGFYSVVSARKGKNHNGPTDPTKMVVRARSLEHLQALIAKFNVPAVITESQDTDYRYRIIISRPVWLHILEDLGSDIDYGNFKDAAAALDQPTIRQYAQNTIYIAALHRVWTEMMALQVREDDTDSWFTDTKDDQETDLGQV